MKVTGTDNKGSIGAHILETLEERPCNVEATKFDVTDANEVVFHYEDTALVMCHGVTHLDWIEDAPWEKLDEIINVNLLGTVLCVQEFVNSTINSPYRKKIIGIGSMAYKKVLNGSAVYCASKAGMAHFMSCIAWELAPKGYDVYTIHPSNVDGTPMCEETIKGLQRYRNISRREAEDYWGSNYVRGRSLTKEEITELVWLLLSSRQEFLSGQQFEMTGGQR